MTSPFTLQYRITTSREQILAITAGEIQDVEGFFAIRAGDHSHGFWTDDTNLDDKITGDWLIVWFDCFLQAILALNSGTKRVSIKELDAYDTWITLARSGEELNVNIVRAPVENGDLLFTERELAVTDREWGVGEILPYADFCREVRGKTRQFLDELLSVDPALREAAAVRDLEALLTRSVG